jgi:hypothetical protein
MVMAKPLKQQNRKALLVGGNLLVYLLLLWSGSFDIKSLKSLIRAIISVSGGLALITIAGGLMDPMMKARLVFLRWQDPLPGSRAFSEVGRCDPRIDMDRLEKHFGPFPEPGAAQNRLWFGFTRPCRMSPRFSTRIAATCLPVTTRFCRS